MNHSTKNTQFKRFLLHNELEKNESILSDENSRRIPNVHCATEDLVVVHLKHKHKRSVGLILLLLVSTENPNYKCSRYDCISFEKYNSKNFEGQGPTPDSKTDHLEKN